MQQVPDLDLGADLLQALPVERLVQGLARVLSTAGQSEALAAGVAVLAQQQDLAVAQDQGSYGIADQGQQVFHAMVRCVGLASAGYRAFRPRGITPRYFSNRPKRWKKEDFRKLRVRKPRRRAASMASFSLR